MLFFIFLSSNKSNDGLFFFTTINKHKTNDKLIGVEKKFGKFEVTAKAERRKGEILQLGSRQLFVNSYFVKSISPRRHKEKTLNSQFRVF